MDIDKYENSTDHIDNVLYNNLSNNLIDNMNAIYKKALEAKGYSFNNDIDLATFIKNNCSAFKYENSNITTYLVNDIPFLEITLTNDFIPEYNESFGNVTISSEYCQYKFL